MQRTILEFRINGKNRKMDIADLRREYLKGGLHREDLPVDPMVLFEKWLRQACDAKLSDPTAMSVATVDANGQPFQRMVLLKHYDADGFVFYCSENGVWLTEHVPARYFRVV